MIFFLLISIVPPSVLTGIEIVSAQENLDNISSDLFPKENSNALFKNISSKLLTGESLSFDELEEL